MQWTRLAVLAVGCLASSAFAQTGTYPYILKSFAGAFPLGDGGPAASALLSYPQAAVTDSTGNIYVLDAGDFRIRKIGAADGNITTFARLPFYGYDMKFGPDGNLYVGGYTGVVRVSPSGAATFVAGTGLYGFSGDGDFATVAKIGWVYGIAFDRQGNLYFTDVSVYGHRVREVTAADNKIQTIAGGPYWGWNGDHQLATKAALYYPSGIAVDNSGNIYVADYSNLRIRVFTVGGVITTFAGNGVYGVEANGSATGSIGTPNGLWLDSFNNLYATDVANGFVLRITPAGVMTRMAGSVVANFTDHGVATGVSLLEPQSVSVDQNSNLYVTDWLHRVIKVTAVGDLLTMSGKPHDGGDNGPAVSAIFSGPQDVAPDGAGAVFIADSGNGRIRRVSPEGILTTFAVPPGIVNAIATDSNRNLYVATNTRVLKYDPAGHISVFAGTGSSGNGGDNGPAASATFSGITGIAVDAKGNVYVADSTANRVRKIAADTGLVTAFAGTGTRGYAGDGALATGAQLDLASPAPLAVDQNGNVYIGDGNNFDIRMVDGNKGLISTVVGNGDFGEPSGGPATSSRFPLAAGLAVDGAGNLYISTDYFSDIYRVSGGIISRIVGNGTDPLVDGATALTTSFYGAGLKVDSNGDVLIADLYNDTVHKLVLNSPSSFVIVDGDNQTAPAGQSLTKALKVRLNGRAGYGISGATVNFSVVSGAATLSTSTALTDNTGTTGVVVTMGQAAGPVTIQATVAGSSLPALQFTETATASAPACSVPQPAITSVNSAGDFGGSAVFAPGSWLEIKGAGLAQSTRSWGGDDFNGASAPTSLDGVSVSINGKKAFVAYISPRQVNVQAPADTASGPVSIVVTTASCASAPATAQEAAAAPGLLAPSSFSSGGTQYLVATFPDGFFAGNPNLIAGVPFRPAAPGDTISAYGIGFGGVAPSVSPGTVTGVANSIPNLSVAFGSTPANTTYAGLAPGVVGLYQFNIVVPKVPDGDYPITFQVGGTKSSQTVYLTVHR